MKKLYNLTLIFILSIFLLSCSGNKGKIYFCIAPPSSTPDMHEMQKNDLRSFNLSDFSGGRHLFHVLEFENENNGRIRYVIDKDGQTIIDNESDINPAWDAEMNSFSLDYLSKSGISLTGNYTFYIYAGNKSGSKKPDLLGKGSFSIM